MRDILTRFVAFLMFCPPVYSAQQSMTGYMMWPTALSMYRNTGNTNCLIDAGLEECAAILMASITGTISKIGFRTATVTTGATVDVRLETVDNTTGNPTGTLWATNTNVSQVIADADDNVWFTTTLTAGAAVTKNDVIALVVVNPSVSPGNLNLSDARNNPMLVGEMEFPYTARFQASAWTRQNNVSPTYYIEYSDGSTVPTGLFPASAVTATAFNNGSTPDERGIIFQLPFPITVAGFFGTFDTDGDQDVVLYDSDGTTALQTLSLDKDIRGSTTAGTPGFRWHLFPTTSALTANTNYRLVIKPTSVTSVRSVEFTVDTASFMDAFDGGQNVYLTTRTDGGAWTQTTTQRSSISLLILGADDAERAGAWGF